MTKDNLIQRKSSPRPKDFDYIGNYAYSITCCTNHGKPYFNHKAIVKDILTILSHTSEELGFGIYAYCFMPDHFHLLFVGNESSSLPKFMRLFKQKSSFLFKKRYGNDPLWQRSYYDHIIRKEEVLEDVALYIFNNPVRKGLVNNYKDYPFSGSFMFNTKKLSGQISGQT